MSIVLLYTYIIIRYSIN